jgi:predicted Fe-Mo cluster-binding NifX family protein
MMDSSLDEKGRECGHVPQREARKGSFMRIAIPVANGVLSMHFAHAQKFAFFDVDEAKKEITSRSEAVPPGHAPGQLPAWLAEEGTNVIIASGMGSRALGLFQQYRIEPIVGAPSEDPEVIVKAYLNGSLSADGNLCDH